MPVLCSQRYPHFVSSRGKIKALKLQQRSRIPPIGPYGTFISTGNFNLLNGGFLRKMLTPLCGVPRAIKLSGQHVNPVGKTWASLVFPPVNMWVPESISARKKPHLCCVTPPGSNYRAVEISPGI